MGRLIFTACAVLVILTGWRAFRDGKKLQVENHALSLQLAQRTQQMETLKRNHETIQSDAQRLHHHSQVPPPQEGPPVAPHGATLLQRASHVALTLAELNTYFLDRDQWLNTVPSIVPLALPTHVTSGFGQRSDPFDDEWAWHQGVDLQGALGTPVLASANGVVLTASRQGNYGLLVIIDHGEELQTYYAHLQRILVNPGDSVHRGDPIGTVGNTGRSSAPHLHYEVRRFGLPVDPQDYMHE